MEAFSFMQHYPNDPSCPELPPTDISGNPAETVFGSPSVTEESIPAKSKHQADDPLTQGETAGRAVPGEHAGSEAEVSDGAADVSRNTENDYEAVYEPAAESAAEHRSKQPRVKSSSGKREGAAANMQAADPKRKNGRKKKKKRKAFSFVDVLKYIFPWRGDSLLETARKLLFVTAMCVFSVCLYLVGNYYIGLYKDRREYAQLEELLEETRRNRGYADVPEQTPTGLNEAVDYMEYNEIADSLLSKNPDVVGYITIEGTKVSYPIVQKKSSDPNINTNDYYLHRNFFQETSKSGCIFLDYRCHFDEVSDHRRVVANSGNILVYGHNMTNESMFGSLRNYIRDYSYYSKHPVVQLQSLYRTYTYKIFACFLVDGEDYTSPYAFNCWNTLDFENEKAFYNYVNNAKKRNIISNDVDVTYGDQILTLYTCSTAIPNSGKLIIMCRMVRPGEDPKEGTEHGHLNDNILYPKAYYANHPETYDPSKFVPYGPKQDQ